MANQRHRLNDFSKALLPGSALARLLASGHAASRLVDALARLHRGTAGVSHREPGAMLLREFLRDPAAVGAICSSSRRLATRIAECVELPLREGYVVELGGGTGAITNALLHSGVPADRLIVFERSRRLVRHLRSRFPRVHVIHDDAAGIARLATDSTPVAALVSGLPLRSLDPKAVHRITRACAGALAVEGRLIQFTYALGATSPWLAAGFTRISSETVWANLPPARIEVFEHSSAALVHSGSAAGS